MFEGVGTNPNLFAFLIFGCNTISIPERNVNANQDDSNENFPMWTRSSQDTSNLNSENSFEFIENYFQN